ncbi:RNA polymerase-associated protein RapA [Saccharobesus litoralis]|uniref:RNA polymerase-associated protein RapA n=1 Tax=Saccharobesus litoralis TaxID=2172099 RepID=A0A2S0VRL9_9ALTE|nr:RNA polymerase-associated protein RapA [Saccharobesus litoralis]AWB66859.1 RNA polymerase-associated protein RapA [Saccharobesus litoralis]
MTDFALGQRWISDSESDLGLGTVVAIQGRRISMLFPATGEQREYVSDTAPLTRVTFNKGDKVDSADEWSIIVEDIEEADGLYIYFGKNADTGEDASLIETRINHHLKLNKPQDRLFTGQIDRNDWYDLRYQSRKFQFNYQTNDLVGLNGARTSLIPHQLHIAKEAGQRFAPRVLLSDEVGLGKTIEAGMIIHQQILTGRASRVLILLPETLQYQWLVEMLRRFNLSFSIFDEERCAEYAESGENPFETEQLIICPLKLLSESEQRQKQACAASWDLVVVDEAHHLKWSPEQPSAEYSCVEQLAAISKGLLLLTATPDQLGHESHFARLRLLDKERFYDYESFVKDEASFKQTADLAKALIGEGNLAADDISQLNSLDANNGEIEQALLTVNSQDAEERLTSRKVILANLIDRHGTGRVLFRNTRASVQGFPQRHVNPVELDYPEEYLSSTRWWLNRHQDQPKVQDVAALLTPEFVYEAEGHEDQPWWLVDPRVDWLSEKIKADKSNKYLVICAKASTALTLEKAFRTLQGINSAVFHEGMSIIERDRAAAWFADMEEGCQVLICSEIGSEGRNFQFANQLVLFDLPLNPDLLEQRIGRLDRIGQRNDIDIHIPYFSGTASESMFKWLHQGINAFADTCPAGVNVFEQQADGLLDALFQLEHDDAVVAPFIDQAQAIITDLNKQMEQGRDILLELNSKGTDGEAIADAILEMDDDTSLIAFMFQVFDVYGVQQEEKGNQCLVVKPTEHMLEPHFPELTDEGMTISFDRETALTRDDVRFVSWDHPMVQGCFDMIARSEVGNNAVSILPNKALPEGTFFVELMYVVETAAPKHLQPGRFLPPTPVRLLLDKSGNNLAAKVAYEGFNKQLKPVNKQTASQLATALQTAVHQLIGVGEGIAQQQMQQIVEQAQERVEVKLAAELSRLQSLQQVNPSIRDVELTALEQQRAELKDYIGQAGVQLDAVRLIVVSHQ